MYNRDLIDFTITKHHNNYLKLYTITTCNRFLNLLSKAYKCEMVKNETVWAF